RAHAPQTRGAARARRRRGVRAGVRRPRAHHWAHRPRRQRCGPRVPQMKGNRSGRAMPTSELLQAHNLVRRAGLEADVEHLAALLARSGKSVENVIGALEAFSEAAPSWAVGSGGTRFGRFAIGGEPRTTEEKVDDVATLNALTAANRSISLHVPWDEPDDPAGLKQYAHAKGIGFDAMNSNTFQDHPSTT